MDDEPINIKLINAVLALEKYELLNAANGQTALDIVANHSRIDLILLDIMMPGMDGYEVTTRLKGEAKTKDIPIILVTALDSRENKLHGLELGADEYITKPINKVEILARIKSMLYLRQYQEQFNIRQLSEKYFISSLNNTKLSQQNTSQASSTLLWLKTTKKILSFLNLSPKAFLMK
ncbi:MAG: response regulator [Chromatiales bacterium]|nr:response regulator [Chromatiales bacterium]